MSEPMEGVVKLSPELEQTIRTIVREEIAACKAAENSTNGHCSNLAAVSGGVPVERYVGIAGKEILRF